MGEGPWWLNLLLGLLAFVGLIPLIGDLLKGILKGGKSLAKLGLKRLIKEPGQELAERLARQVGEEVALDLLDKLGKEALRGDRSSHIARPTPRSRTPAATRATESRGACRRRRRGTQGNARREQASRMQRHPRVAG
jgi:hypothetical protein